MSDAAIGRTVTAHDEVSPRLLAGLAATLGVSVPSALPPLWHWMLFQDWVPPDQLGPDGHPRRGGFLPAAEGLPRRMWAGGRVRLLGRLLPGEAVERVSTIAAIEEKEGSSGRLLFVTVRHVVTGPGGPAIEEEQDLVYRGVEGLAVKPAAPATDRLVPGQDRPGDELLGEVLPDPVMLFRYSALTGNGHRIHYDLDYVRQVEGYPGLVVHGPLQATWLAGLLGGHALRRFSFRGQRPAFHGQPLTLEGRRDGALYRLRTLDAEGAVCMQAEAEVAPAAGLPP